MGLHGRALPYALVALFAARHGAAAHGLPTGRRPARGGRPSTRAGASRRAISPGPRRRRFDDAGWRVLDLPHDWAIEGPFDPAISPHQGSLPFFGVAWYRKRFEVPESARGRYYALEIDGAMSNATVFLNGRELGGRPYGYIGFAVDLTPHLRFGGENVLAVRLAPEPESSRWYPGAGLYRHVWIEATGPGARGAVGHLRDDAGRDRGRGDGGGAHRAPQSRERSRPGRPRDGDPRSRAVARSRGACRARPFPPAPPRPRSSGSPWSGPGSGTWSVPTSTR